MLVPPAATVTVWRSYPEALQANVAGVPQLVVPPPPLLPVPLTETFALLVPLPPTTE